MSPTLNGGTALQRFERGNVVEIRNGIMFDFYPGLPHMYVSMCDRGGSGDIQRLVSGTDSTLDNPTYNNLEG